MEYRIYKNRPKGRFYYVLYWLFMNEKSTELQPFCGFTFGAVGEI